MPLTYGVSSTSTSFASNPTSCAVPYPTGIKAGSLLIMTMGCHPDTKTITTPSGWTAPANSNQTGGAGAFAATTGPCRHAMFFKVADGTETGTLAVTVSSVASSLCWGSMIRVEAHTRTYDVICTNGVDTTAGASWSTTGSQIDVAVGDFLFAHSTNPNSASNPSGTSAESLGATGITTSFSFSDTLNIIDLTNNDIAGHGVGVSVTAGIATSGPTHSCTYAATATNTAGPEIYMRVREVPTDRLVTYTPYLIRAHYW